MGGGGGLTALCRHFGTFQALETTERLVWYLFMFERAIEIIFLNILNTVKWWISRKKIKWRYSLVKWNNYIFLIIRKVIILNTFRWKNINFVYDEWKTNLYTKPKLKTCFIWRTLFYSKLYELLYVSSTKICNYTAKIRHFTQFI